MSQSQEGGAGGRALPFRDPNPFPLKAPLLPVDLESSPYMEEGDKNERRGSESSVMGQKWTCPSAPIPLARAQSLGCIKLQRRLGKQSLWVPGRTKEIV